MANAVIEAVKSGELPTVEEFVRQNPGLASSVDDSGVSALTLAVYYGQSEIAKVLAHYAPTMTMHEAAALGDMETLRALSRWPDTLSSYSPDGWTPLHLAAAFGGDEAVSFLLEHGANPNQWSRNLMNNLPLHACVAISHSTHTAKILLAKGASINAKQHGGFTALHAAAFNGDLPMVRLLVDSGASVDVKTDDGQTPLDLAREKQRDEVVKLLEATRLDVRSL